MARKSKPKLVNIQIQLGIPSGVTLRRVRVGLNGNISLEDMNGQSVEATDVVRTVHYPRTKGPKIQSRSEVGGLQQLARFDALCGLDTNTRVIAGEKVSVACFFFCWLVPDKGKYRVEGDGKIRFYELRNVDGNAELLAIAKLAIDLPRFLPSKMKRVAVVTDCELGLHEQFNRRSLPIYKNLFLSKPATLVYASSDTGNELINRIIRTCDSQSTQLLRWLEAGAVIQSPLYPLPEDRNVRFRYLQNKMIILKGEAREPTLQPGTKVEVYGVK